MDPDACWEAIVERAKTVYDLYDVDDGKPNIGYSAISMAELILNLDSWLKKGGFQPKAFTKEGK